MRSMSKIHIPQKRKLYITEQDEDCGKCYYMPIIGNFYLKRIKMVCALIKQKGQRVLDLGYGCGILFYELRDRFSELNGMELRSDGNLIKKTLAAAGIKASLTNGNLFHLPYKEASFDCVVAMSVLEHISDLGQPLREIKRVLKKGGSFICGFPTKNFYMHQFFKLMRFDDEKGHPSSHNYIYQMLKRNFSIDKTIKFPSFLKMDYCLYITCRCKKMDIAGEEKQGAHFAG